MKKIYLLLLLICACISGNAQHYFNDTIFYKSGLERPVEIIDYANNRIIYRYHNSKGEEIESSVNYHTVKYYKAYDELNILQIDSRMEIAEEKKEKHDNKYPEEVTTAKHTLSVNPFFLPFLSANVRYTYVFGERMQYAINSRFTYMSEIMTAVFGYQTIRIGAGIKFIPLYNYKYSVWADLTPLVHFPLDNSPMRLEIPITFGTDLYLTKKIGLSFDFGIGTSISEGQTSATARGHLGVLFQLGEQKTFKTKY